MFSIELVHVSLALQMCGLFAGIILSQTLILIQTACKSYAIINFASLIFFIIIIIIIAQITRSKCNKVQSLSCHNQKAKHGEPGKDERVGPDLNARRKLFSKVCLQLLPTSLNTRVR